MPPRRRAALAIGATAAALCALVAAGAPDPAVSASPAVDAGPASPSAPAAASPTSATAANDPRYVPVGRLGGPTTKVLLDGERAIALEGAGLSIVDVHDVAAPRPLSRLMLPSDGTAMALAGGYAYVAVKDAIVVADLTQPELPRIVRSVSLPDWVVGGLSAGEGMLRASAHACERVGCSTKLWAWDTDDPGRPQTYDLGSADLQDYATRTTGLAAAGLWVYVAADGDGIVFVDRGRLGSIAMSATGTDGRAADLVLRDEMLYVADDATPPVITAFDLSRRIWPEERSYHVLDGSPVALDARGDRLFILERPYAAPHDYPGTPGLRVMRLDGAGGMTEASRLVLPESDVTDVAVADGRAVVAAGDGGMLTLAAPDGARPTLAGRVDAVSFSRACDVVATAGLLVVGDPAGTVAVIDRSDPGAMKEIGRMQLPGRPCGLAMDGHLLAVASGDEGLALVDLSDPGHPTVLSRMDEARHIGTADVALAGGFAYVAELPGHGHDGETGGLRVVDVRDPRAPTVAAHVPDGDGVSAVAVEGAILGALGAQVLRLFDVADPSAPREIGQRAFEPEWDARAVDVAVHGGTVLATHGWCDTFPPAGYASGGWLEAIDPAAPTQPIGRLHLDAPGRLAVDGEVAFVRAECAAAETVAIDVAEPTALRRMSSPVGGAETHRRGAQLAADAGTLLVVGNAIEALQPLPRFAVHLPYATRDASLDHAGPPSVAAGPDVRSGSAPVAEDRGPSAVDERTASQGRPTAEDVFGGWRCYAPGAADPCFRVIHDAALLDAGLGWAVGQGVIMRWDGSSWTVAAEMPGVTLEAVDVRAEDDAWAVGLGGAVFRWDGATWSRMPFPRGRWLTDVAVLARDDVWIVGDGGFLMHWDGTGFAVNGAGTNRHLGAVAFDLSGTGWATSTGNELLAKWRGSHSWSTVWPADPTPCRSYGDIALASPTEGWMVGPCATDGVMRYDGTYWRPVETGLGPFMRPVRLAGVAPSRAWLLAHNALQSREGLRDGVGRWDGTSWTVSELPEARDWRALATDGVETAWAFGASAAGFGVAARLEGGAWGMALDAPEFARYTAASLDENDHGWLAAYRAPGGAGRPYETTILRWDGSRWESTYEATVGGTELVRDIAGVARNDAWAVGEGGILHWDGAAWTVYRDASAVPPLRGIAMAGADLGFAVGDGGAILAWDGADWSPAVSPTASNLSAVDVASAGEAWAVGEEGTVLRLEGGAWRRVPPPASATSIVAVDFEPNGTGWVAGPEGAWRWDGADWAAAPLPPGADVTDLATLSDAEAWAATDDGLYRWGGARWVWVGPAGSILAMGDGAGWLAGSVLWRFDALEGASRAR